MAGDLLTSGESVLVAVADIARRRASLESLIAGLAPAGLPVVSWSALETDPGLCAGFEHLVALDPPPGGSHDPLLCSAPFGHLAWGPAEVEFALAVWRSELDLRPALAAAWRELGELRQGDQTEAIAAALRGGARYPRSAACCGRMLRILRELALLEYSSRAEGGPACCLLTTGQRTDLERSATYRWCRERLLAVERALDIDRDPGAKSLAVQA